MKKNNSGITLLALIIIVIVLIIIASISVYEGRELIAKSKVQTLETNMLTIQAKAKSYAEEIDAKIWTESGENKDSKRDNEFNKKGFINPSSSLDNKYEEQISSEIMDNNNYISYELSNEPSNESSKNALSEMGLDDINGESYIVVYDKTDYKKLDIIYTNGVTYKKVTYYTLSKLKNALSND